MKSTIILVGLLFLCIFRMPLAAAFHFRKIIIPLDLLPLLFLIIIFVTRYRSEDLRKRAQLLWGKSWFRWNILLFAYAVSYIALTLYSMDAGATQAVRELMSTTLFLIFPLLLFLSFKRNELLFILNCTLRGVVFVAFFLTLSEFVLIQFHFFNATEIRYWLMGEIYTSPIRINTFMGQGAISSLIPLSAYVFYFFNATESFYSHITVKRDEKALLALSFLTILMSDSFTLVLILILISAGTVYYFMRNDVKHKGIAFSRKQFLSRLSFLFLAILILMCITPLGERFIAYFYRGQIIAALGNYYPRLSQCHLSSLIFGFPHSDGYVQSAECRSGEFHGIHMIFQVGLLVQILWYLFLLSPIYATIKFVRGDRSSHLLALILGALVFPLALIHYAGAEIWGNNYVLALFVVLVFKEQVASAAFH